MAEMPNIRPISDLRNNANEISELCHGSHDPVFITKNGKGDMVVMSIETYERQQAQLELYAKLAEAEADIIAGAKSENFREFAEKLRAEVHGKL